MSDVGALTLAEFLLARIAEDEAGAVGACRWHGREWHTDDTGCCVQDLGPETTVAEQTRTSGAHIARFDPGRVLAECEAKRKIVERCQLAYQLYLDGFAHEILADDVLDQLAMPYAGHPDYRDEWKPEWPVHRSRPAPTGGSQSARSAPPGTKPAPDTADKTA